MEVNRQDVTFAEVIISPPGHTSFRDMEYAFGLGCSASFTTKGCPLLGYFKIDTRGTGLVVSSSVRTGNILTYFVFYVFVMGILIILI